MAVQRRLVRPAINLGTILRDRKDNKTMQRNEYSVRKLVMPGLVPGIHVLAA
jgi:hypothetical protein